MWNPKVSGGGKSNTASFINKTHSPPISLELGFHLGKTQSAFSISDWFYLKRRSQTEVHCPIWQLLVTRGYFPLNGSYSIKLQVSLLMRALFQVLSTAGGRELLYLDPQTQALQLPQRVLLAKC